MKDGDFKEVKTVPQPKAEARRPCKGFEWPETGAQGFGQQGQGRAACGEWWLCLQGAEHVKSGHPVRWKPFWRPGSSLEAAWEGVLWWQDGSKCPASPVSDEVSVDAAPKDKKSGQTGKRVAKKILAKSGDAAFQYEILKVETSFFHYLSVWRPWAWARS